MKQKKNRLCRKEGGRKGVGLRRSIFHRMEGLLFCQNWCVLWCMRVCCVCCLCTNYGTLNEGSMGEGTDEDMSHVSGRGELILVASHDGLSPHKEGKQGPNWPIGPVGGGTDDVLWGNATHTDIVLLGGWWGGWTINVIDDGGGVWWLWQQSYGDCDNNRCSCCRCCCC